MHVTALALVPTVGLLAVLWPAAQLGTPSGPVETDVSRLVNAAERLTDTWPSQPPPAVREVAAVAAHGRPASPLLVALLSDEPSARLDQMRWKTQQQATLALCRILSEAPQCGIVYCDGASAERTGRIKQWWEARIAADASLRALTPAELLERFRAEKVFWRQFEIARALAEPADLSVVRGLEPWLKADDRHVRGNTAYVLARLGHPAALDALADILTDGSARGEGQGARARWSLAGQIATDRYYAAHLLGDLKDPRGVPLLVPLLHDRDVKYIVPWSLGEIGAHAAVEPLLKVLDEDDPSMRVIAIAALETLGAQEALPKLRELRVDPRHASFGEGTTVSEAARHAIAGIMATARQ
jgi:HEAT repeat protein